MTGKLISSLCLLDDVDCYEDLTVQKKILLQLVLLLTLMTSFWAVKKTSGCFANAMASFFEDDPGRYRYFTVSLLLTLELFGYGCKYFSINERVAHFFRPSIRLSQAEIAKNMHEMQENYTNKLCDSNEAKRVQFQPQLQITFYYP